MPPIAQRLREPAAFALLAYGAISALFNTITFLFGPGEGGGGAGSPTFSERAAGEVHSLLSPVVVAALIGAVMLAHLSAHVKNAKIISLVALGALGVVDLFGLVALFSSFGADATVGPLGLSTSGWDKTTIFFIGLAELAIAGIASWLALGYFQQFHQPAKPAGGFQPPQQQWGPGPQQQQAPQQQWQQPQTGAPQQQPWGPPPQQQQPPQQAAPQQQPQPQWGQPQPQQDADSMMTQAIPTVPPAPQGQQPPQQQQQQPPQQDGGLPIGNWTSE